MSEETKRPSELDVMRSRVASLEKQVYELKCAVFKGQWPPIFARSASQQHDELTEVCQLFGKSLYVRLDWRDPDQAKEECDQIRSSIIEAFQRAYGWFKDPEEAKQ